MYRKSYIHFTAILVTACIYMALPLGVLASVGDKLGLEESQTITIEDAFKLALGVNPELKVLELERDVGEGALRQAGLMPNPEISIEAENILGTGPYRGNKRSEVTLGLSQLIELGKKRAKRKNLAKLEKELVEWDLAVRQTELWLEVKTIFIASLIAQEKTYLSKKQVSIAEEFLEAVKDRMESGRGSSVEVKRAKINLYLKKAEFIKTERAFALVRQQLSLILTNSPTNSFTAQGNLVLDESPPSLRELLPLLECSPMLRRYQNEKERTKAALELEKSRGIPNVSVFGGVRRINDESETALVLGLGVPLPIFDRNQGNIYSARARARQLDYKQDATKLELQNLLVQNYEAINSSYHEAKLLKEDIVLEAEYAFADMEDGYKRARYSLLEVLDSQRTFFDIKMQYLDAIARYHQAYAQIQWIINSRTVTSMN